ncbi:MAG: hypothetical protein ABSH32_20800, partial [Bryobacteraceae bacterium]
MASASPTYTTFDAPGAGTGTSEGTIAASINTTGVIAGYYRDNSSLLHGFVRTASGIMTTFDVPGANSTVPASINAAGVIAGSYGDDVVGGVLWHGFVRAADGTITGFDAPGAGTGAGGATLSISINGTGAVAGYYTDASNVSHGFVRAASGAMTTFDVAGAGTGSNQGTFPWSINGAGV